MIRRQQHVGRRFWRRLSKLSHISTWLSTRTIELNVPEFRPGRSFLVRASWAELPGRRPQHWAAGQHSLCQFTETTMVALSSIQLALPTPETQWFTGWLGSVSGPDSTLINHHGIPQPATHSPTLFFNCQLKQSMLFLALIGCHSPAQFIFINV